MRKTSNKSGASVHGVFFPNAGPETIAKPSARPICFVFPIQARRDSLNWNGLTGAQWELIRPHLPPKRLHPKGGRPRASDRKCLDAILWVLLNHAPWSMLPPRFGSPVTAWRRMWEWESSGAFADLWNAFLEPLSAQERACWDRCATAGKLSFARRAPQGFKALPSTTKPLGWFRQAFKDDAPR